MTRESMILEFSSTMVALILAGKMGSKIASEIGTMRISQQLDAIDMMGINSASFVARPKILAATVTSPLLTILSIVLGLVGGGLITWLTGMIPLVKYLTGLRFAFNAYYVLYSCVKTAVFCLYNHLSISISWIQCEKWFSGVGRSSTKAIVTSSILILVEQTCSSPSSCYIKSRLR